MTETAALLSCALFIATNVLLFVTRKSDSGAVLVAAAALWIAGFALYIICITGDVA